jgi:Sulfotransferase domain
MLNFLCIGAQKSGTTWMYETLLRHPKIAFPGGKEVHHWDGAHNSEVEWYLKLFSNDSHINGDITPAYGILPKKVIQNIYGLFPHLRLIYLIRNPMERAWSSARMALARAEMASDEGSDQWFIDHFMSKGSLARGDYETCIREWRSVFPASQLLIMRYETIKNDPVLAANKVLNHVGLESFFEKSDDQKLREKVFEGDGAAIRPSLIPVLQDIYRNRIDSLERYLQEDFSNWIK